MSVNLLSVHMKAETNVCWQILNNLTISQLLMLVVGTVSFSSDKSKNSFSMQLENTEKRIENRLESKIGISRTYQACLSGRWAAVVDLFP